MKNKKKKCLTNKKTTCSPYYFKNLIKIRYKIHYLYRKIEKQVFDREIKCRDHSDLIFICDIPPCPKTYT